MRAIHLDTVRAGERPIHVYSTELAWTHLRHALHSAGRCVCTKAGRRKSGLGQQMVIFCETIEISAALF